MGYIQPYIQPASPLAPEQYCCGYCGAPLDFRYYFCRICAAPYTIPEAIVGVARPAPLSESELIRRKAPHVWTIFWTYLSVIVGSMLVAFLVMDQRRPDLQYLFAVAALTVTTAIFASLHFGSLRPQLQEIGFLNVAAWIGLGVLVPLLLLNFGYHGLITWALDLKQESEPNFGFGTMLALFCIYPAIAEEVAFRGLLQHWLSAALRPWRAIILASALFSALHLSIISAPYLFLVGMLLGWVKWKTGSLYPSMLIHFLHNACVIYYFGLL